MKTLKRLSGSKFLYLTLVFAAGLAVMGIGSLSFAQSDVEPGKKPVAKGLTHEKWLNLPGKGIGKLRGSGEVYTAPDSKGTASRTEGEQNTGDNFGSRMRGYIVPPSDGLYTFWVEGDDRVEFRLSGNAAKFGQRRAAWTDKETDPLDFGQFQSQRSAPRLLKKGKRYYVELLHKEGVDADHCALAWSYFKGEMVNWTREEGVVAKQSSVVSAGGPERAIDGTRGIRYSGKSITMTRNNPGSWWEVDLGTDRPVSEIAIFNRSGDGDHLRKRLSNFRVILFNSAGEVVKHRDFSPLRGHVHRYAMWRFTEEPETVSKVRIEMLGKNRAGNHILSLAEVEVWGPRNVEVKHIGRRIIPEPRLRPFVQAPIDKDDDDLHDDWERRFEFNDQIVEEGDKHPLSDPDGDGLKNIRETKLDRDPWKPTSLKGHITQERWNNSPFYETDEFVMSDKFFGPPTAFEQREIDKLSIPLNTKRYFGGRFRARLFPHKTGTYRFWISSRTAAELWLSTNGAKSQKRRIAWLAPSAGAGHGVPASAWNKFDRFASQMSAGIELEKGKKYFLEIIHQHGHGKEPHVAVAWEVPGSDVRNVIPGFRLKSYTKWTGDSDDDSLPDDWEREFGLDPADNGGGDRGREGERGDFDGDGLNNLEEFQYKTDPNNVDSDGDGILDGDEVHVNGTDPALADQIRGEVIAALDLGAPVEGWMNMDGELMAEHFRSRLDWEFNVQKQGYYYYEIKLRAEGNLRTTEEIPVSLHLDGSGLSGKRLRFSGRTPVVWRVVGPRIHAGTHLLSIIPDNDLVRRSLVLQSVEVKSPAGIDSDGDGMPDWFAQELEKLGGVNQEQVVSSKVAPFCLEGEVSADWSEVLVNRKPASALGPNRWYYNLPLKGRITDYKVHIPGRGVVEGSVRWEATNVLESQTLQIRAGDRLKFRAIGGDGEPVAASVSGDIGGVSLSNGARQHIHKFDQPGTYIIRGDAGPSGSGTVTVEVIGFDLADQYTVVANKLRVIELPGNGTPAGVHYEGIAGLSVQDIGKGEDGVGRLRLIPEYGGELALAARIGAGGPILDTARVPSIVVADSMAQDSTLTFRSGAPPGYYRLRAPIVVLNLPEGAYVELTIFRAGVMFADGSTSKRLTAADFEDGLAFVDFWFPDGMKGGYCHYIEVYDENGEQLARR